MKLTNIFLLLGFFWTVKCLNVQDGHLTRHRREIDESIEEAQARLFDTDRAADALTGIEKGVKADPYYIEDQTAQITRALKTDVARYKAAKKQGIAQSDDKVIELARKILRIVTTLEVAKFMADSRARQGVEMAQRRGIHRPTAYQFPQYNYGYLYGLPSRDPGADMTQPFQDQQQLPKLPHAITPPPPPPALPPLPAYPPLPVYPQALPYTQTQQPIPQYQSQNFPQGFTPMATSDSGTTYPQGNTPPPPPPPPPQAPAIQHAKKHFHAKPKPLPAPTSPEGHAQYSIFGEMGPPASPIVTSAQPQSYVQPQAPGNWQPPAMQAPQVEKATDEEKSQQDNHLELRPLYPDLLKSQHDKPPASVKPPPVTTSNSAASLAAPAQPVQPPPSTPPPMSSPLQDYQSQTPLTPVQPPPVPPPPPIITQPSLPVPPPVPPLMVAPPQAPPVQSPVQAFQAPPPPIVSPPTLTRTPANYQSYPMADQNQNPPTMTQAEYTAASITPLNTLQQPIILQDDTAQVVDAKQRAFITHKSAVAVENIEKEIGLDEKTIESLIDDVKRVSEKQRAIYEGAVLRDRLDEENAPATLRAIKEEKLLRDEELEGKAKETIEQINRLEQVMTLVEAAKFDAERRANQRLQVAQMWKNNMYGRTQKRHSIPKVGARKQSAKIHKEVSKRSRDTRTKKSIIVNSLGKKYATLRSVPNDIFKN